MHDENYLIICDSLRMAYDLFQRLAEYLDDHYVTNLKVRRQYLTITSTVPNVKIHFISKANAYEECHGFHGTIRTGYEVDKFLEPWERDRRKHDAIERFCAML